MIKFVGNRQGARPSIKPNSMMKKCLLVASILLIWHTQANAQYTFTDHNTADELLEKITGESIVVLNPVLSCGDTSNGTFTGTGSLDFDEGIVLTTNNTLDISPYTDGHPFYPEGKMDTDEGMDVDMNNYLLDSGYVYIEAYNACVLEFDIVPQTPEVELDYIFASAQAGGYAGLGGCDPTSDLPVIFIKGGTEFPNYMNIAAYPGTNIPVNTSSLTPGIMVPDGCVYYDGAPYDEYYVDNGGGAAAPDIDYWHFSKQLTAHAEVTPCDTYHLKLAMADIRGIAIGWGVSGSALFFKANSLKGTGQPTDCSTGMPAYIRQQSGIKVLPNPFHASLSIAIEGDHQNELFSVALRDVQGRVINSYKGSLAAINTQLQAAGEQLSPGMYFLNIKSESGRYNHSVKTVKE